MGKKDSDKTFSLKKAVIEFLNAGAKWSKVPNYLQSPFVA